MTEVSVKFESTSESRGEAARMLRGFAAVIAGEAYDQETAEASGLESSPASGAKKPGGKPGSKTTKAADNATSELGEAASSMETAVTMDDLRAIASEILESESESITDEFEALLKKYKTDKLSKLKPEHFDAMLPELKKLQKKASL